MKKIVEVVAGVLLAGDGRFLLGSRPAGKPYAGYWEFPGGKIEAGETPLAALARELDEEMGIAVTEATPWLTRRHDYEHARVNLRFFRVSGWRGEFEAREGQRFAWQWPGRVDVEPVLPANGSILKSLQLPSILSGPFGAGELLDAARLMTLTRRPPGEWVGARIATREQLDRAARLELDYVVLESQDGALAWPAFDAILADGIPLPVFAGGGLVAADLGLAHKHGAHGIASGPFAC
ncbi:NUDIX domain-containing protein [Paludibacterium yongneupense]|uniref:NUDIX domain-containing protein n=1 Tax=Paludibacterium yongneupense TaxID=400061 RepID=UPI00041BFE3A|nr:NUDIX domain-containing protein [Paludibacterium yongneupense]